MSASLVVAQSMVAGGYLEVPRPHRYEPQSEEHEWAFHRIMISGSFFFFFFILSKYDESIFHISPTFKGFLKDR